MIPPTDEIDRTKIYECVFRYIMLGAVATIVFVLIANYLEDRGWNTDFKKIFYFVPWAVALVLGVATSFHRGIVDEYIHATGFKTPAEAVDSGLDLPFPKPYPENWEHPIIFNETLWLIISAAIATLALYGFVAIANWQDDPLYHPFVLFTPWIVYLAYGTARAYLLGVSTNRRRLRGRREADRRKGPRRQSQLPLPSAVEKMEAMAHEKTLGKPAKRKKP